VVVAEAAPAYAGHGMAWQLAQAKVQTTLIADSAVFAMMARVNKVGLVCVRTVCSDS
jgi:translation initiation factor eIF-2B subunit beta